MKHQHFFTLIFTLSLFFLTSLVPAHAQAPCTSCAAYSGSLNDSGAYAYEPNGEYYQTASATTHRGWLRGAAGVDFDLYLLRWDGSQWVEVAKSDSPSANEEIAYAGAPGYYLWKVKSYDGAGNYQLWLQLGSATPAPSYRLTATPNVVAPGATVAVNYTAAQGNAGDWVGMYRVGEGNQTFLAWQRANGTTSGTMSFTMPTTRGQYEFRYLTNNSYTDVARSNQVQVGAVATAALTVNTSAVMPGGQVTVNFTAANPTNSDWIGLYAVGSSNNSFIAYQWNYGRTAGSLTFTMPTTPGQYEFRYLTNSSYTDLARSRVEVRASSVPTISWATDATAQRGQNGTRITRNCPANGTANAVWGTGAYTDDSSICTAAVHAGLISFTNGGVVTYEIRPGQDIYGASTRNGVTTRAYGYWHGSFVFAR